MIHIAIILNCLALIALSYAVWREISDNKSHWKATTHELAQVWESINTLELVDPERVGEPTVCAVPDEYIEKLSKAK